MKTYDIIRLLAMARHASSFAQTTYGHPQFTKTVNLNNYCIEKTYHTIRVNMVLIVTSVHVADKL